MKLRGRAKAVTFHVLDPRQIEDILDEDRPVVWREDDARGAAENRRRAAAKAALARASKSQGIKGARPKATRTMACERRWKAGMRSQPTVSSVERQMRGRFLGAGR